MFMANYVHRFIICMMGVCEVVDSPNNSGYLYLSFKGLLYHMYDTLFLYRSSLVFLHQ